MGKSMDSENIVQGEEKNRLIRIRFVRQSGNEKTKYTTLVTNKQTKKQIVNDCMRNEKN